jgi:hypothetical protein
MGTVMLCGLCFLGTLRVEGGGFPHYLSILVCSCVLFFWIRSNDKTTRKIWTWGFAAIFCSLFLLHVKTDYYEQFWVSKNGFFYRDSVTRWGDYTFYRSMWKAEKDSYISASGGFSDSGKQHGEWKYETGKSLFDNRSYSVWYWYGEELSEGEWHSKNK